MQEEQCNIEWKWREIVSNVISVSPWEQFEGGGKPDNRGGKRYGNPQKV